MKLKEIIRSIRQNCPENKLSVGALIDSIEEDIFGVLLLLPSLIVLLPISLIPGVTSLCAIIVLFSAMHIFLGRRALWLPQRIREIQVNGRKMFNALEKMSHFAKKADDLAKPRLTFLTRGLGQKLTSAMGVVLAATTLVLGFIPLIDLVLMAPMIFFGLGICTNDGLMTSLGWTILGVSLGTTMCFI